MRHYIACVNLHIIQQLTGRVRNGPRAIKNHIRTLRQTIDNLVVDMSIGKTSPKYVRPRVCRAIHRIEALQLLLPYATDFYLALQETHSRFIYDYIMMQRDGQLRPHCLLRFVRQAEYLASRYVYQIEPIARAHNFKVLRAEHPDYSISYHLT